MSHVYDTIDDTQLEQDAVAQSTGEETASTEESPDRVPAKRRTRQQTDSYTVGYEATGNTRVGIGHSAPRSRLERLIRQNEGRHRSDGQHSTREAIRDKKRITQSFCSTLDVTPYQQREAVSIMSQLNLNNFGRQKRLEKVALGVIRFIVDYDRQRLFFDGQSPETLDLSSIDVSRYPPSLGDETRYQDLCERHDLSSADRYSLSQLVKREIKRIGYIE